MCNVSIHIVREKASADLFERRQGAGGEDSENAEVNCLLFVLLFSPVCPTEPFFYAIHHRHRHHHRHHHHHHLLPSRPPRPLCRKHRQPLRTPQTCPRPCVVVKHCPLLITSAVHITIVTGCELLEHLCPHPARHRQLLQIFRGQRLPEMCSD